MSPHQPVPGAGFFKRLQCNRISLTLQASYTPSPSSSHSLLDASLRLLYNQSKAKPMYLRSALLLLISVLLFGQSSAPQTQPPDQAPPPVQPPIRIQVNEVIVPVTVTDEKGRFVSDLDQKDFTILDEGKEQRIEFFTRERSQPVVAGFLVDLSNASRLHWKNYQDAAIELVQNLNPGDNPKYSGYLIGYSNTADLLVD